MTTAMTIELREVERDYLLSLGRCRTCDHLGALHHDTLDDEDEFDDDLSYEWCLVPDCPCLALK